MSGLVSLKSAGLTRVVRIEFDTLWTPETIAFDATLQVLCWKSYLNHAICLKFGMCYLNAILNRSALPHRVDVIVRERAFPGRTLDREPRTLVQSAETLVRHDWIWVQCTETLDRAPRTLCVGAFVPEKPRVLPDLCVVGWKRV